MVKAIKGAQHSVNLTNSNRYLITALVGLQTRLGRRTKKHRFRARFDSVVFLHFWVGSEVILSIWEFCRECHAVRDAAKWSTLEHLSLEMMAEMIDDLFVCGPASPR